MPQSALAAACTNVRLHTLRMTGVLIEASHGLVPHFPSLRILILVRIEVRTIVAILRHCAPQLQHLRITPRPGSELGVRDSQRLDNVLVTCRNLETLELEDISMRYWQEMTLAFWPCLHTLRLRNVTPPAYVAALITNAQCKLRHLWMVGVDHAELFLSEWTSDLVESSLALCHHLESLCFSITAPFTPRTYAIVVQAATTISTFQKLTYYASRCHGTPGLVDSRQIPAALGVHTLELFGLGRWDQLKYFEHTFPNVNELIVRDDASHPQIVYKLCRLFPRLTTVHVSPVINFAATFVHTEAGTTTTLARAYTHVRFGTILKYLY
jgi:hypothetical protein